jgi:hypothetical protein
MHREELVRWATAVSESAGLSPVLLIPDPAQTAPGEFRLFATGSALLRFAGGLNGLCSSCPVGLDEEHADVISAFFGILRAWVTAADRQHSIQAELDVSRALSAQITELARAGFVVGARDRFVLLTGGIEAKPLSWRIVDVTVQPAALVKAQRWPLPVSSPKSRTSSAGRLPSAAMGSERER